MEALRSLKVKSRSQDQRALNKDWMESFGYVCVLQPYDIKRMYAAGAMRVCMHLRKSQSLLCKYTNEVYCRSWNRSKCIVR